VLRFDVKAALAELGVLLGLVCIDFLGAKSAEHDWDELGTFLLELLGPVGRLLSEELRNNPVFLHL